MTIFYLRNEFKHNEIILFDFSRKSISIPMKISDEPKISGVFERIEGIICAIVRPSIAGFAEIDDFFIIGNKHYFFDDTSISAGYQNSTETLKCFNLRKNGQLISEIIHTPEYHMDSLGYGYGNDSNNILFSITSKLRQL